MSYYGHQNGRIDPELLFRVFSYIIVHIMCFPPFLSHNIIQPQLIVYNILITR